ncbi:hypothetical protein [Alicyclobacillus ferrooxydans]|uniref:hypothetical protein n=1 Tax=Alicyclobacillus ferrooxydans TaxID=471514 RepID=UPI000B00A0E0|nr:hypothetical protein [Alicyclobacillus ferrooxydans]
MSHKRTNDESKVAWPFKDEHEKGLRNKHVDLPSMRTELTQQSIDRGSGDSTSSKRG